MCELWGDKPYQNSERVVMKLNQSKTVTLNSAQKVFRATAHMTKLFNRGVFGISEAEHLAKHGYEFIMKPGGEVLAIIPPFAEIR